MARHVRIQSGVQARFSFQEYAAGLLTTGPPGFGNVGQPPRTAAILVEVLSAYTGAHFSKSQGCLDACRGSRLRGALR